MAGDEAEAGLRHARSDAIEEAELPDRGVHGLVVHELLDLLEDRLPFRTDPARLLLDEPLDVRVGPVGVDAGGGHEGVDTRRRVAEGPAADLDDVRELLFPELAEEGDALEGAQLQLNAHGLQIVDGRLREIFVGDVTVELAGVEAVRVPGFGQELRRFLGVVGVQGGRPGELEVLRDDAPRDFREAQRFGLIDGLPVEGQVGGEAHALVGPRRLGIPLLGEEQPERAGDGGRLEGEARGPLELLRQRAPDRVDDVDLAPLQRRQAGRLVGDHAEAQRLDARRLAPVVLVGLEHELDARRERHEAVRPGADGRLLEPVVSNLLHIFLRDDPAGAGRRAAVEGHEVGPGLLQSEAHPLGVHDLHRGDLLLQELRGRASVALEGELDVLGGDRIAVVELDAFAQDELVGQAVGRGAPGLRQARRHALARHGLHEGVVERVVEHERGDDPGRLGGIEPGGGQRDVDAPGHLAVRGDGGRDRVANEQQREEGSKETARMSHRAHLQVRAVRSLQKTNRPARSVAVQRRGQRGSARWT